MTDFAALMSVLFAEGCGDEPASDAMASCGTRESAIARALTGVACLMPAGVSAGAWLWRSSLELPTLIARRAPAPPLRP